MTDWDGRSEMDLPLAAPRHDLSLRRAMKPQALRRDPMIWGAAIMLATAAGVAAWLIVNGDPAGGQPRAHVAVHIDPELRSEDIALPERTDPMSLEGAWQEASVQLPPAGRDRVLSLSADVDPALVEDSVYGFLPRISEDGRRPMDAYARPTVRFAGRTRARVAVVLTGLGLSERGTAATIEAMPGGVTLAFVPYPDEVASWAAKARRDGHETLLQVPQEPFGYPNNDPGPRAILSHLSAEENVERLRWSLARMHGYVGVAPFMGGRLALDQDALRPVVREVAARGLLYVDDGSNPGSQLGAAAATVGAKAVATTARLQPGNASEVDAQLAAFEQQALSHGAGIVIAEAHPDIVARIGTWAATLEERGLLLAPVSSVASATPVAAQ